MSDQPYSFSYSRTQMHVGQGSVEQLPEALAINSVGKPLIVTDTGIVEAGLVEKVTTLLRAEAFEYHVFDGVRPNPTTESAMDCVTAYKEYGCDGLIAIGGGSSMDTAKAAGVCATNPGRPGQYVGQVVPCALPYLACVPSTHGTGSEVTPVSVLIDEHGFKGSIGHPHLIPNVAFLDSNFAVGLPHGLAASTGMDAMTHAIEAYISKAANPFTDALALEAMKKVRYNIIEAAESTTNHPATEEMLVGSSMAGFAFSVARLGVVHAMSHPAGGHYDVPHGFANAIILPYALEFNQKHCLDKFAAMSVALGGRSNADEFIDLIRGLNESLSIPKTLGEMGVNRDKLDKMVTDAMRSRNVEFNPREMTYENIRELFERVI